MTTAPQPVPSDRIVCTLTDGEAVEQRVAEWHELLSRSTGRTETAAGFRLSFPADPQLAGRLADVAVREQRCCSFFRFTLEISADGIALDVAAPPDARPVLASLFG